MVLHSHVLGPCLTAQLRQLRFSFPDRGRQEYFVSAPGRLLLTASKAKTQPNMAVNQRELPLWFAFGLSEGRMKLFTVTCSCPSSFFEFMSVTELCPDKTTRQAHHGMPFFVPTFSLVDVGFVLSKSLP